VVVRRGASTLGCLLPLLVVALAAYIGRDFGEAYFRYYQYRDAMREEARFATIRSDEVITSHLRTLVDSLDLPHNAGAVRISHTRDGITIWSDYYETIKLPFDHEKTLHFHPTSERGN
jgi:hypothetical protein